MARMQNLIAMETDQPYIDMLALDMVVHISGYGAHSTACSWRRQTQIDIHAKLAHRHTLCICAGTRGQQEPKNIHMTIFGGQI